MVLLGGLLTNILFLSILICVLVEPFLLAHDGIFFPHVCFLWSIIPSRYLTGNKYLD